MTAVEGWKFFGTDEVLSRTAWKYRSGRERTLTTPVGEALHWVRYPAGVLETGGLLISGRGGPAAALELRTAQGTFSFALSEAGWTQPLEALQGAVRVTRLPAQARLSRELREIGRAHV